MDQQNLKVAVILMFFSYVQLFFDLLGEFYDRWRINKKIIIHLINHKNLTPQSEGKSYS